MTALEIITTSLKLIGVLSHGEVAEPEEAQDCLARMNTMLNTWAAERLSTYVVNRSLYTLTAGQQRYTLGPTGDFVQQRPQWIDRMGILQQQNTDQPIELPLKLLTTQRWLGQVPVKNITSSLPTRVYVDGAFPNRNMDFWPFPDIGNLQISVYWAESLSQFTVLTTDTSFPPAYDEAIIYNLAVRLMPEFGHQTDPAIVVRALELFSIVKSSQMATHMEELVVDDALTATGKTFDWRSDNTAT